MPNTYTQLYIQLVFAVNFRKAVLDAKGDKRLRLYITGIIQNNGHTMIAINNMPDHMHMLIGLNPAQSLSNIMQLVKGDSSEWINKENLTAQKFSWQNGYGAFSYSRSQIDRVAKYIQHQQEHHKKQCFIEEYRKMLEAFSIEYDKRYIFQKMEG